MDNASTPIDELALQLSKLPGIGSKTALRLAYHIIALPLEQVRELAGAITDAKEKIKYCSICGNYTMADPCGICSNQRRTSDILCVVKDPRDVLAMERTREFCGKYHVLHGTISPMDGIGPGDIRIAELIARIPREDVKEVIIATNPDVEGEATAVYIAQQLKPLGVKVSRIAHGIPVGGNLEYIDEVTLAMAMEGRRNM
jgi:recombination protein RecR